MRIVLTRLTDRTHRFEIVRRDGSQERVELETRSLLLHDLVHYAVEAEAGIAAGFYGSLAAGVPMDALADRDHPPEGEGLAMAESLVGPMQSLYHGRASRELYVERAGARYPDVVDEAFVDGVLERLRRLVGRWKATPFGEAMELTWPPPEEMRGDGL